MASWKKVIVSGSQAELCSLTVKGTGGTTQTLTDDSSTTSLLGTFDGTHIGDGKQLTNVTGSKVDVDNTTANSAGRILLTGADTDKALQACNSANLTFNASQCRLSTGQVSATGFTGSLNGNADTATTATTATCITLTGAADADATHYIPFADGATGVQELLTDGQITYNPSTDTLSVTNISGTVSNATTASAVTVTDSDGNTNYTLVFATTGTGTKELLSDNTLTYNANTDVLTTGGDVVVGSGTATATICSNGSHDLILQTGGTAACITLEQGSDQPITLAPNGTGVVKIGGGKTITTVDSDLTLGDGVVNVCVTNDLNVGGDLIVSGELAYLNVTNLAVEDRFILLNSGSASGDGGIIVQNSTAPTGSAFIFDDSADRWGFTASLASSATTSTPDAYVPAVVESDIAYYCKNGNIRVDTGNGDIYIYS